MNCIYCSGGNRQDQAIGWALIGNVASANAYGATTRHFAGSTAPGSAIAFEALLFSHSGFEGTRNVIKVSGDSVANLGITTAVAHDAALVG